MPSTLFDSAGLAIVAYAQVKGSDGSSENSTALANSGIYTTRLSRGQYLVQMSTALGQDPSRDLIFVQPTTTFTSYPAFPPGSLVSDKDDYNKIVSFGTLDPINTGSSTMLDCDFNILVLRTILP